MILPFSSTTAAAILLFFGVTATPSLAHGTSSSGLSHRSSNAHRRLASSLEPLLPPTSPANNNNSTSAASFSSASATSSGDAASEMHTMETRSKDSERAGRKGKKGGKRGKHGKGKGGKKAGGVAVVKVGRGNGQWQGKKAGLAWPNGNQEGVNSWCGAGWYYTWSPWSVQELTNCGQEFVPMLWGHRQEYDFVDQQKNWPSSTKHVLFVNEPNQEGQSDMSVGDAVDMWWRLMEPLKDQYTLGLAATTSAPTGKEWIREFLNQCQGCSIGFLPIHWYDTDPQQFQRYVQSFYDAFKLPIWVTELACQNFNGGSQCDYDFIRNDFFAQTIGWMNNVDYVQRHSWFGAMHDMQNVSPSNQIMGEDGRPNDLGWKYLTA